MSAKRTFTVQAKSGRKRREATKSDLVAATKRLLEAGAPVATISVDRIVEEAGVARTTFYLHFRDKHDLIGHLAEEQIAWRETIGAEALAEPTLSRETLGAMLQAIVDQWVANQAVLSAIVEISEYDPEMRDIWLKAMREVAETAAAQFENRWMEDGGRPRNPAMIAEIFTWMFERCCHQIARDPTRKDELADSMSEVIWRTLTYPGAPA